MTTYRLFLRFVLVVIFVLLQGCSGGSSSSGNPQPPLLAGPEFVYVGSVNSPATNPTQIAIFRVDPSTGALSSPAIMLTNAVSGSGVDPFGKVLYIGDGLTGGIHEYAINGGNGVLTEFAGSPFPLPVKVTGTPPFTGAALFTDPQEKFVYDLSCGYNRDSAGTLTPIIPGSCFAEIGGFEAAVHPNGKFVFYACNIIDFAICAASINQVGVLVRVSEEGPSRFEAHDMAMHPSGNFIYASGDLALLPPPPNNPPSPEQIAILNFNASTGTLAVLNQITLKVPADRTAIAVTPNGKFLYVVDATNMYAFSVNADGNLTPVSGSPFPGGHTMQPFSRALQVDNTGQFLYLAATDINAVVGFKIDPNSGAISPIPGSPFPIGASPSTMVVVRTP
jgi:6-phosphogluconolactonase (cycloisomerase 2 family)